MKKQLLVFVSIIATSFISNAQISNNSFEMWAPRTSTIGIPPLLPAETFTYSEPDDWSSSNQATGHSGLGNGYFATQDTSIKYHGTSSIKMESNTVTLPVIGDFTIPALVVTGAFTIDPLDFATGNIDPFAVPGVGFPVTGKPSKMVGYFRYDPDGIDTCEIAVALVDSARNEVAFGILRNTGTAGAFTRFEIDFVYTSCNRPDTICLIASSSPITTGANSAGMDGSTLWIDSIGVSYTPAPNIQPIANNDTVIAYRNNPLTISTLLSNDSDCDGGTLSVASTTTPIHGTNTNTATTVTYTPNLNYVGNDIFEYVLSDGTGGTSRAFVIVNVLNNTGIENTNDISFSIYPNPVSNNLIVDGLKNNAPFFITDLNSKKAIEGNLNSNTNSIDVSNLQNGTYFINVNGAIKKFNVIK
jgi:hypothetical protein